MHASIRGGVLRAARRVGALQLLALVATASGGCVAADEGRPPASIEFRDGPCRDAPHAGDAGGAGGAGRSAEPARPALLPPGHLLAFDDQDRLVLVDASSGAVVADAQATAGSPVRDLVFDRWQGRALIFESDADEQSGEVVAHQVTPPVPDAPSPPRGGPAPGLGGRQHLAWIDGRARLLASPAMGVLFEEAYGTRWRAVPGDVGPAPSLIAPRPASAWATLEAPHRVHALLHGPPAAPGAPASLQLASAPLGGAIGPLQLEPTLLVAGTDPPTARALDAPALGGVVLVDVIDATPVLRLLHDGEASEAEPLLEAGSVMRIEAAVGLHGGRTVALLSSGPARVLVARLAEGGAVLSEARLDLAGEAREESQFFSHDLLAIGDERLLAATSAGVSALSVSVSDGVSLDVDAAFAGATLRGPLAAIDAPPP